MAEKSDEQEKEILGKAFVAFQKKYIQDNDYWDYGIVYNRLEDRLVKVTSAAFKPPPGISPDSTAFKNAQKYVDRFISMTNKLRTGQWETEQRMLPIKMALESTILKPSFENRRSYQRRANETPEQSEAHKIADQNARELIQEEEEAKLKGQRKKSKKKRQKQSEEQVKPSNFTDVPVATGKSSERDSSDAFGKGKAVNLQDTPVFVNKAQKKVDKQTVENKKPGIQSGKGVKDVEPIFKMALEFIDKKAYKEAVQTLSMAIDLAPTRADLLLKRSWVYFEIAKYQKSLRDAENSLKIFPSCPEAYYRLGEANRALKNHRAADAAFCQLVDDPTYKQEVKDKLFCLRLKQLEELGYNSNEAFTALHKSGNQSLGEAIDFLKSLQNGTVSKDDLYYSDEEDSEVEDSDVEEEESADKADSVQENILHQGNNKFTAEIVISNKSLLLMDPTNPFKCYSLFVGNMKKYVTFQEVQDVFAKFGKISSVKLMTFPRVYAFVNFVEWQSAGHAMEALQGSRGLLSASKTLKIKYPVNIVNDLIPHMTDRKVILSKLKSEEEQQSHGKYGPKPNQSRLLNRAYKQHNKDEPVPPPPGPPGPAHPRSKPRSSVRVFSPRKPTWNVKGTIESNGATSKAPGVQPEPKGKPRPSIKTEREI